jgi:hypothetical protein
VMSGVGLLATWMSVPEPAPQFSAVPAPPALVTPTRVAAAAVEAEVARLSRGLAYEGGMREGSRNPFRFGAVPESDVTPSLPPVAPTQAVAVTTLPRPVRLTLAGIATDVVTGVIVRTAIISTPNGIVLAGVGDVVFGDYHVRAIDPGGVDLSRDGDGVALTLLLRP